ncbi:MAG TPA: DUF805 domain-containing protein [Bauldia sp.]|nr:DUF805 domain-containing protein [Bauldia sp.]
MAAPASTEQILRFFFRIDGRIGREEYALGIGVVYSLNLSILFYLIVRETMTPVTIVLLILFDLIILIGLAVLMAKRCHDLGLPGSYFLLILVPVVGLFWPFALAFLPGNPAANLYGPPPEFEPE